MYCANCGTGKVIENPNNIGSPNQLKFEEAYCNKCNVISKVFDYDIDRVQWIEEAPDGK